MNRRCCCTECDCPALVDADEWVDGVRVCFNCDVGHHFVDEQPLREEDES